MADSTAVLLALWAPTGNSREWGILTPQTGSYNWRQYPVPGERQGGVLLSVWSGVECLFRERFRKERWGLVSERKDSRQTGIMKPRKGEMQTLWRVRRWGGG